MGVCLVPGNGFSVWNCVFCLGACLVHESVFSVWN